MFLLMFPHVSPLSSMINAHSVYKRRFRTYVRLSVEQWRPPAAGELHTDTLRCQCLLHITHTDFNGKSPVLPFRWGGVLTERLLHRGINKHDTVKAAMCTALQVRHQAAGDNRSRGQPRVQRRRRWPLPASRRCGSRPPAQGAGPAALPAAVPPTSCWRRGLGCSRSGCRSSRRSCSRKSHLRRSGRRSRQSTHSTRGSRYWRPMGSLRHSPCSCNRLRGWRHC